MSFFSVCLTENRTDSILKETLEADDLQNVQL